MANIDELRRLSSLREALDTELKGWIDPATPEGKAKIAKACIALYNNNGGHLFIGFDDTGKPDPTGKPQDVAASFHPDIIQGIVTRFSSQIFAVDVVHDNWTIGGTAVEYVVIEVPSGVQVPAAAKSDLHDQGRNLVSCDTVYVRTVRPGQVSSAPIPYQHWEELMRILRDNYEADFGRFLRRHIANQESRDQLFSVLTTIKTPAEVAREFLDTGIARFKDLMAKRGKAIPDVGMREASIVIGGTVPPHAANADFLTTLQIGKPNHSGWTPWVDVSRSPNPSYHPHVFENGWEALLYDDPPDPFFGAMLDFWRMEPAGKFYHLRALEDDMETQQARKPPPRTQLDFMLQISRVAEIISVGLSFARSLGCAEADTALDFAFRWSGLDGRHLSSWVEPMRTVYSRGPSHQDVITTAVRVSLETPESGYATLVAKAVAPLFALFGGMSFDPVVFEQIVNQTIARRL